MGFKSTYASAELVTVMRLLIEKRSEAGIATHAAQIDFACAYDSIHYSAVLASMRRLAVPEPLAMVYVREMRRAHMTFEHASWETTPSQAGVGLRQVCSAATMISRWILADAMQYLHDDLVARGPGEAAGEALTIFHVVWAGDTWLMNETYQGLDQMLTELVPAVRQQTGLVIRWDMCAYAQLTGAAHPEPTQNSAPMLANVDLYTEVDCLNIPGFAVQFGRDKTEEWASSESAGQRTTFGGISGEREAAQWRRFACSMWQCFSQS